MKHIWKIITFGLALGCFFLAVRHSMASEQAAGIVTSFLRGQTLDLAAAEEICGKEAQQEDARTVCFWGEQRDMALSCQTTGKSGIATVIVTVGNPELVMAGTGAVIWQEKGCFVDQETAETLFGTREAAGQRLQCGSETYTVCGTFESLQRAMVRCAEAGDGEVLTALSLFFPEQKNVKSETEQLLMRHGLNGTCINYVFAVSLARDLLLIFPAILVLGILRWLLCQPSEFLREGRDPATGKSKPPVTGWNQEMLSPDPDGEFSVAGEAEGFVSRTCRTRSFCSQIPRMLLSAAAVAAFFWLVSAWLVIPADMIPTKWSDFSFWSEWWTGEKQNLLLILGTAQAQAQLTLLWNVLLSGVWNLVSVFLLLIQVSLPSFMFSRR